MVAYYVVRKEEKQIYLVTGMEMNFASLCLACVCSLGS